MTRVWLQELLGARCFSHAAWRPLCSVRAARTSPTSLLTLPPPPFSYGPFNFNGSFTTDSNRKFDGWLKSRSALSGIRDFEAVRDAAAKVGQRGRHG